MKSPFEELIWKLNPILSSPAVKSITDATTKIRGVVAAQEMPSVLKIINDSAWYQTTINTNAVVNAVNKQMELRNYAAALQMIERYRGDQVWEDVTEELTVDTSDLTVNLWNLGFNQESEEDQNVVRESDGQERIIIDESKRVQRIISDIYNDNERIFSISPREFEEMTAELLRAQGFHVDLTKQTRDGGYDLLAIRYLDKFTPLKLLVECKRYAKDKPIGVGIVRAFKEVVSEQNANRGIIVASSYFTADANKKREATPYLLDFRDKNHIMDWIKEYQGKIIL